MLRQLFFGGGAKRGKHNSPPPPPWLRGCFSSHYNFDLQTLTDIVSMLKKKIQPIMFQR